MQLSMSYVLAAVLCGMANAAPQGITTSTTFLAAPTGSAITSTFERHDIVSSVAKSGVVDSFERSTSTAPSPPSDRAVASSFTSLGSLGVVTSTVKPSSSPVVTSTFEQGGGISASFFSIGSRDGVVTSTIESSHGIVTSTVERSGSITSSFTGIGSGVVTSTFPESSGVVSSFADIDVASSFTTRGRVTSSFGPSSVVSSTFVSATAV